MSKIITEYSDVHAFHSKFGVPTDNDIAVPTLISEEDAAYRADFMQEEKDEYVAACKAGDLPLALDALIDLVYVVKGTALLHGVSEACWDALWADVQAANMRKERATSADDPRSKRSHSLDVVKPEGWIGPDGAAILRAFDADV